MWNLFRWGRAEENLQVVQKVECNQAVKSSDGDMEHRGDAGHPGLPDGVPLDFRIRGDGMERSLH